MLLFYKIYICKKAAFLQDRFFTPHIYMYIIYVIEQKHTYIDTEQNY